MKLLESDRLILRELRGGDAERVERYANDEEINRYLIFGDLARRPGAEKYVAQAMKNATLPLAERRSFKLAILLKEEDANFIGSCWLDIAEKAHRRATVGYFIDKAYWGRGYAGEALAALLQFGFETLGLHRIEATCDAGHKATRRVLERGGLTREARLRQHRPRQNGWSDSILYAIIEKDSATP
ncbi:MAG: GNAT family N-acetyltransferase [Cyanobacteria bacterium REEB67]|nr:GNAT family N-acetyltransferase [Cyanobacteria bacterium REEB67]